MDDHDSSSDMVELKAVTATPSSPGGVSDNSGDASNANGGLLHPQSSPPPLIKIPSSDGGKHARFNIEKVDSPTSENTNAFNNQNTIHDMDTIGYATHEAVPLTMFYRNEASVPGHAKARPTLAELHKGFDELDEIEVGLCDLFTGNFFDMFVGEVKYFAVKVHLVVPWFCSKIRSSYHYTGSLQPKHLRLRINFLTLLWTGLIGFYCVTNWVF